MPRQGRSGGGSRAPARPSAPSRPVAAPARQVAPQQQTRPSSTSAAPPAAAPPAQQQVGSQGPGMMGQIASTAIGVGIGSSVGHMIGGFFGGGSSAAPEPAQDANVAASGTGAGAQQNNWGARNCDVDAKQFTKCLDDNAGNMQICGWYLEQLKACQSAASQY